MKEVKKLYRSRDNRMVSGLCAGFGNYMGIDPTVVRVVYTIATVLFAGVPAALYVILLMVVPEEPLSGPGVGGDANN